MTVIFNRRRTGEVQYLNVQTYLKIYESTNNEEFALTDLENILTNKFKRVVTGGKGTRLVPILFSKKLQKFIDLMLEICQLIHLIPDTNPYLFANINSKDKWMSGSNILRTISKKFGVKHSDLLTSTRIRKHVATTLQIMHLEDDEMEQIASFIGHTKKTYTKFYK